MKKVLSFLTVFVLLEAFATNVWGQFYDFTATAPSGQTLYYRIYNGEAYAYVVRPGTGSSYINYVTGDLTIPSSVSNGGTTYAVIGLENGEQCGVFEGCSGLTSVTIPNSVTWIGTHTFYNCSGLTSVTIPNNVTHIGSYAFSGCSGLTSVTIPDSVTSIGFCTFANCSGLTSVTIPNNVTSIGGYAFCGCTGLTSVSIPNSVTSIGSYAFYGCTGLTSVSIPDSVTSIGLRTFTYCIGLTSVTIPNSVTLISEDAFCNCTSLDTVYMMPTTPPTLGYSNVFGNNALDRVFIINSCSYNNYYTIDSNNYWYTYRNNLRHALYDINVNVLSSNSDYGIATVVLGPGNRVVRCDSTVVVQATANNQYQYHFVHWSNADQSVLSIANPDTIILTGDTTIIAHFERNSYNLTVNVNDASLGSVSTPQGSSAFYQDTLMVVAQPTAHYHVASWQGEGIVTRSAHKDTAWVKMDNNRTLTCIFAIDTHSVAVTSSDIVRGMVEASGTEFVYGTPCTVTATAYTGYTFHHWSNGVTANPYTFAVMEDVELTAIFLAPGEETYTVTVGVNDPAMGNASANGNASAIVMGGETVTLTATANEGYRFVRWNDNNNEATRTITVTSDTTFTAFFEAVQGISDVQILNSAKIFASDGQIVVEGAEGEAVYMYDINGRLLERKMESGERRTFDVPASGAYLIKIGNHPARKVVVIR